MPVTYFYGTALTGLAVAACNGGETVGNIATLQKVFFNDVLHTSISSESIRFAWRYRFQLQKLKVNRSYDMEKGVLSYVDETHDSWNNGVYFIDDDLMGFMDARAAKVEIEGEKQSARSRKNAAQSLLAKGTRNQRRSPLAVARAVSLRPYRGESSFNCVSGNKTAQKPTIYTTEMHTTEYQYSFALNLNDVADKSSIPHLLDAIIDPPQVGGKHSHFYYDFSPVSILMRVTNEHSSRIQNCFEYDEASRETRLTRLIERVESRDIPANELVLGGEISKTLDGQKLRELGALVCAGTKDAMAEIKQRMST